MAKKKKKKTSTKQEVLAPETKKGIVIVVVFLVGVISALSLFELAGQFGTTIDLILGIAFGWGKWLFPVLVLSWGYILLNPDKYLLKPSNYIGLFVAIISASGILELIYNFNYTHASYTVDKGGGYIGFALVQPLISVMGSLASFLILIGLFIISLLVSFNISLDELGNKINIFKLFWLKIKDFSWSRNKNDYEEDDDNDYQESEEEPEEEDDDYEESEEEYDNESEEKPNKKSFIKKPVSPSVKKIMPKVDVPLDLLDKNGSAPTSVDIKANSEIIHDTLANFGIESEMNEVNVGPTVTQFTLKPAEGTRMSQINNLHNDIAYALAAHPIRIEAPIPGKSLVGIEVPNQKIATVKLREIIESKNFQNSSSRLAVSLGKDVTGNVQIADIAKMPHCLIAGATGSGKSVCINTFITSLLYRNNPDELKFIMVDPKRVELTIYNDIPHLLTPVITEVPKTINALRWAVAEMDNRYKLLESVRKKDIESYNSSVLTNKLPYIVLVIDELADLMAMAAKEVEAAIIRLAQMARAVGIHLVIATQRPSTNVITGLIKANITNRLAFKVASQIDSRTIIDSSGAEKLLGNGDLLFVSAEISKPKRLQGAFISDKEIKKVVAFWKEQGEPEYEDEVTEKQKGVMLPGSSALDDDDDELLPEAQEVVLKSNRASTTLLQRRLKVGYARAARLMDLLESNGIVGPANGSKPREILVSQEDLEENLDTREYKNDGWEDEEDDTVDNEMEENQNQDYNEDEDD